MEKRSPDSAGGIFTSQHAAEIILALKSIRPKQGGISRPVINLIQAALEEFSIHLQVEDIAGGVLLFWQAQEDFNKSARLLNTLGTNLREPPLWEQGDVKWELTLLKPAGQTEGRRFLEECRNLVINLFGPESVAEFSFPSFSFRAPKVLKFLDELWRFYKTRHH